MAPPDLLPGADSLPIIEAERITLRPLTRADAEPLFAVYSDPEVMRYWNTPPHPSVEHTRKLLGALEREFADRSVLQWGVERTSDRELVGCVTLMPAARQPRAEIGYILGREHWGKGYAGEAQRAAIDFGFSELGLERIEADVHPDNAASLRSLERLGFVREGLLRERWIVSGEPSDSVMLGLLAGEYGTR